MAVTQLSSGGTEILQFILLEKFCAWMDIGRQKLERSLTNNFAEKNFPALFVISNDP
jgi:hypothetical protein